MVPIDGKVREGVGLLGSPSFEIPRTVERDSKFADLVTEEERRRSLAAKNRHNLVTMGLFLLARWFFAFVVTLLGLCALNLYPSLGVSAIALSTVLTLLFSVAYFVLVERASTGFRPLKPKYCSIYDIDFWRTERFFKLKPASAQSFDGTPFKRRDLADAGCPARQDGSSTTAATWAEKNLVDDRRRRQLSTPGPGSSATPRRTTPSSPTASRSVPAAPSGSAP